MSDTKNELKGLIFNIQKFSLDDGPGIRTTVFMKGCPLRCQWCSNPESFRQEPQIMLSDRKCIVCKKCEETCPVNAIKFNNEIREIDWHQCNNCLQCAEACPSKAIELVGEYKTVDDVFRIVAQDESFYRNSGGGVTISGGEAMLQWEFVMALLTKCKKTGYHTAIDTTGFCRWEHLDSVLDYVDLVLFDIKHLDAAAHKEKTGVSNDIIIENLEKTVEKVDVWLRLPIIPGYNDSKDLLEKTAQLAAKMNIKKVSILPYHDWGAQKYPRLGMKYPCNHIQSISADDDCVNETQKIFKSYGLNVGIGK